ncbi:MAG: ABC transporter ATP-binding protein [Gemmatimonadota bacterium]
MSLYGRIGGYLRPHSPAVSLAVVASAFYAVFDAATYVLLIPFVDAIFAGGAPPAEESVNGMQTLLQGTVYRWVDLDGDPLEAVTRVIVLIVLAFLAKNLFGFARSVLLARAEQGVNRDLRRDVYDHLLGLDLAFFGRTKTGQLLSRITTEIEHFRTLVTREASKIVSAGFEFVFAVAAMLLISWKLTLAAFVVIPAAMGVWGPLVGVLRRRDRRVLDLGGDVAAHVEETLSGIRLVKSASAEGRERGRFATLTEEYFERVMRAEVARSLAAPMTEMLAAAGTVVLLGYGARLVVAGELPEAQFIGFLGLSLKLYAPVKNVAKFPAVAQPGLVAAERVFEVLDRAPRVVSADDAPRLAPFASEIVFDDVSFAYEGSDVLTDLHFVVPKGSVVALVGPSGAGKTTVVDLLARFYDPAAGSVRIDGCDLRHVDIGSLRAQLGIVSQDAVLFHDTVRANIAYAAPGASAADVEAAARAAHAHEFITALPDGYDTRVGERGVQLSGGERQRIAIARALLVDPPILVFDEATSALDSESERHIQAAITELMTGRTAIVVAHRLSTVQRADEILVLDGGRIVERGNHEQLMAEGGLYRRLHDLQFSPVP